MPLVGRVPVVLGIAGHQMVNQTVDCVRNSGAALVGHGCILPDWIFFLLKGLTVVGRLRLLLRLGLGGLEGHENTRREGDAMGGWVDFSGRR